jgi:hypothetical protein
MVTVAVLCQCLNSQMLATEFTQNKNELLKKSTHNNGGHRFPCPYACKPRPVLYNKGRPKKTIHKKIER